MKIWVVVPVCRPDGIQRSLDNFRRQSHPDKRLLFVLNGDARPFEQLCEEAVVLFSEQHQSAARNIALGYLRQFDEYVVFMDDDDYYGEEYLSEHARLAEHNTIIGKQPFWVRFKDGYALFRRGQENREVSWVRGGTIGGYARELPDFPMLEIGEEIALCEEFRKRGGKVRCSGLGHVVYDRTRLDHTFAATPQGVCLSWGPWCEWFGDADVAAWVHSDEEPPSGERRSFSMLPPR